MHPSKRAGESPGWFVVTCASGRHEADIRGRLDAEAELRVQRESGCSACKASEPSPLDVADPFAVPAPTSTPASKSDHYAGDRATSRAARRMDHLRGGAPRPRGA